MKRAKKDKTDSITFDDGARLEFLTGFRKRKLQKKETAKSKAKERERKKRLQSRKEQRQALKERAEENARLVESAWKQAIGNTESDDEDVIVSSSSDKGKGKATQEFEDEQQLATVTIVEEFDPEALRHGHSISKATEAADSKPEPSAQGSSRSRVKKDGSSLNSWGSPQSGPIREKRKDRPRKVAYETRAARRTARLKRHARKLEKADFAATGRGGRRKVEKRIRKVNR